MNATTSVDQIFSGLSEVEQAILDQADRFAREADRPMREPDRPRRAPASDPFFDRPYEAAAAAGDKPAWEQKSPVAAPIRGLSPNIRSKRKVASLLGGGGST